jgi:hypothetical protein
MRSVYRILDGKPEGKQLFGRLRHRWEDNIKMSDMRMQTGFMWLRIGASGRLL